MSKGLFLSMARRRVSVMQTSDSIAIITLAALITAQTSMPSLGPTSLAELSVITDTISTPGATCSDTSAPTAP